MMTTPFTVAGYSRFCRPFAGTRWHIVTAANIPICNAVTRDEWVYCDDLGLMDQAHVCPYCRKKVLPMKPAKNPGNGSAKNYRPQPVMWRKDATKDWGKREPTNRQMLYLYRHGLISKGASGVLTMADAAARINAHKQELEQTE